MPSRAPEPIKVSLHLWSTHANVSFASVENSVMQAMPLKTGVRAQALSSKRKHTKLSTVLVINFSTSWICMESSCFYFPQMPRKMT